MRAVCIDAGNTSVKVGLFDRNKLVETLVVRDVPGKSISKKVERFNADRAVVSNVGSATPWWNDVLKGNRITLDANTPLPFRVNYANVRTLGADRMALAAAASAMFPGRNTLVIATGTCITYNIVTHQGVFIGGAISPGLHMRLRAMHEYTAKLPLVKTITDEEPVAASTRASLISGALHGAAFEMDGFIETVKRRHSGLAVVLTGGDLPYFEPRVKSKIFARPHAALYGLFAILQHNTGDT